MKKYACHHEWHQTAANAFCDVKRASLGKSTDKLMPRWWIITNAVSNCNKIAVNKVNKLELLAAKTSNRYFMKISRNCILHRKSSLFCTQKIYTFESGCVELNVMDFLLMGTSWWSSRRRFSLSKRENSSVVKWKARVRASTTKRDIFDLLSRWS